ncbi:ankyrin repeat domain-containing protein 50-like [Haliotis rubra]|uniref:ankyrin repeat domain-containing protein 50-like n=1 Tax=Haliotis rubra TaxID=36100 RepID=UPI001EE51A96|nr:ankyrin repeat domain-containing protein 50-like [Haliotis rubra]XP_046555767.1 ankyrin repeat domain-containing protein 50-like [Haliotis rubra]
MSTDVPKRERKATCGDEDEPTVEMKLKHLENDFERTSQAITDDIMKYRGIELEIEDLKVEHQRRKDNTDKVSIEDIPDLQEQIEVLNGDLRELKADLERFRTEDVADLGTKIQNLKDELEVLTQDTEDTEEHKAEANEKVQTMKGSLHQLNTYSESEREKRYALHKKITDLESKLGLREKQKPVDGFGDENFVQDSSGDQPSETDIHTACREGDLDRVKQLLSGPEANDSLDKNGTSLLMTAVEYGHRDEFDFLVSKGFDVYQVDKFGNNVLHVACIGGDVDLVSYIITQNIVDINSRGQFGRTPVMAAAEKGHKIVLDVLVSHGADLYCVDDDGDNILHAACLGGHVQMVEYLVAQEIVGINSRGDNGRTPLMAASGMGHRGVFYYLLSKGADVSMLCQKKNNILHVACFGGDSTMVNHILSNNFFDINSKGEYGRTPLLAAAGKGHRDVLDLLLQTGCLATSVDDNGHNMLHVACLGAEVDMVKHVLSKNIVEKNSRDRYGRSPVMLAAMTGCRQAVDVLLEQSADVNLVDDSGNNILQAACLSNEADMVKYLISLQKLDINHKNASGSTAAVLAKEQGYISLYDSLVSQGCSKE